MFQKNVIFILFYIYFSWKIDKRWTVPNIGKLELLYLETQLSTQQQEQQQHEKQQQHKQSFKNHDNKDVQKRRFATSKYYFYIFFILSMLCLTRHLFF